MPSRRDMLCAPEGRWDRAQWIDENMPIHLAHLPLTREGWGEVAKLERHLFPPPMTAFLGGPLDPTCPACGIETDEGTVERVGQLFRVHYQTCGCVYDLTEEQLRSRVRHASGA